MLFYGLIIVICMMFITGINLLFSLPAAAYGMGGVALLVVVSTATIILLDGLLAFLIRRLPKRWFSRGRNIFTVSRRECHFYRMLGVRWWRDKIPELGCFTGFHKNRVYEPENNDYIARFILECNYGVVIHLAGALFGFLLVFFHPVSFALGVGLPIAIVNFLLNLLPLFVLRYNTPKLEALYTINERREKKIACQ